MSALLGLLRKELYHILRDKRTLVVLVLLPVVQVLLFGYAIRTDIQDVRIAIIDPAPDATTLSIRSRLAGTRHFRITAVQPTDRGLDSLFQVEAASVAVEFQPRFATRLASGLPAQVLVIADAADPNGGTQRQTYVTSVLRAWQADRVAGSSSPRRVGTLQITTDIRTRFNPTGESSNLLIPGLMALILTITSALMTALSLTRERETGTMEALLVSPLRPTQIIIGKVAPYLAIGFVSVIAVLIEARVVFHVPVRGSVILLLLEGLLYILVSLSLGILISARTSSQRVAMMATIVGTMLPTIMLSGFVFPIESMPTVLQWITPIVPARWFVSIARGIMLVGVGLDYLWPETLVLGTMALVLLVLSVRSFHSRLE
jgi:ABC-2 type transport system permease protein